MMTKQQVHKNGGIIVYDGGEPIDILNSSDVNIIDTWGGARICPDGEYQEGQIKYKGSMIPVMCDGDETYAVYSY